MNKAVIFDLDGTLIHSLPDIHQNINVMLRRFGYAEKTEKEIMNYIGNGARKLVERSLGEGVSDEEVDKCLAFYNKIYTESGSPLTALFDGIGEVLEELKARGYKLGILTNKPQITTDDVYNKYLQNFNFDVVVGQRKGVKCKPDKEAVLNILKELDVSVDNAYFVGDGETDVMVAINAGIKEVSVLWGYRDKSVLMQYGAETFVEKPKDILNLIF